MSTVSQTTIQSSYTFKTARLKSSYVFKPAGIQSNYKTKSVKVQSKYNLGGVSGNTGSINRGSSSIPSGTRVGSGGLGSGPRGNSGSINRGASSVPNGGRVGSGGLGSGPRGNSGSINRGTNSISNGGRVGSGGLNSGPRGNSGSINRGASNMPSGRRVGSGGLGGRSGNPGAISRTGNGGRSLAGGGGLTRSRGGLGGGSLSRGGTGGSSGGGGVLGGTPVGGGSGNKTGSTGPGETTFVYVEHRKPVSASVSVLVEERYDPATGLLLAPEVKVLKVMLGGKDSTPGRADSLSTEPWEDLVMGYYYGGFVISDDCALEEIEEHDEPVMSEIIAKDGIGYGQVISKEWRPLFISNGSGSKSTTRINLSCEAGASVWVEGVRFKP